MKLVKSIALLGILIIGMSGSAQAATYDYTLDIELLDGYSGLTDAEKIASLAFDLATGDAQITNYTIGVTLPTGWILANGHPSYAMYDDIVANNPITSSGNIITIFSETPLTFLDLEFYDADGTAILADPVLSQNVFTSGFQAVPIPAAAWLLGSGLLGLVALKRRRSS